MKNTLMALGIWIVLAASAYGQSRYDVAFGFQVSDKHFAAGRYHVSTDPMNGGLTISSAAGSTVLVRPNGSVEGAPSSGKLVFRCYDHSCFLAQVWQSGSRIGSQLPRSRAEREIARTSPSKPVAIVQASLR